MKILLQHKPIWPEISLKNFLLFNLHKKVKVIRIYQLVSEAKVE